eukprot:scaffold208742_cov15-Tisochrysis_lutea.AAC.1
MPWISTQKKACAISNPLEGFRHAESAILDSSPSNSSTTGVKRGAAALGAPQGSDQCARVGGQEEGPAAKRRALAGAPDATDHGNGAGQEVPCSLLPSRESSASLAAGGQLCAGELQGVQGSNAKHQPHPGPQQ